MGQFRPLQPAQKTPARPLDTELTLLDDAFDEELDFHDEHVAALEITNQFSTH